jgi:hypothetical protein
LRPREIPPVRGCFKKRSSGGCATACAPFLLVVDEACGEFADGLEPDRCRNMVDAGNTVVLRMTMGPEA